MIRQEYIKLRRGFMFIAVALLLLFLATFVNATAYYDSHNYALTSQTGSSSINCRGMTILTNFTATTVDLLYFNKTTNLSTATNWYIYEGYAKTVSSGQDCALMNQTPIISGVFNNLIANISSVNSSFKLNNNTKYMLMVDTLGNGSTYYYRTGVTLPIIGSSNKILWTGYSSGNAISTNAIQIFDSIVFKDSCIENWIQNNSECNNYNYTIQYYDNSSCDTYNNLPVNNSTIIDCSTPSNCTPLWVEQYSPTNCLNGTQTLYYEDILYCGNYTDIPIDNSTQISCNISNTCVFEICINPIKSTEYCCMVTPTLYCANNNYSYELYDNNGFLIENANLTIFNTVDNSYYWNFNKEVGTYYAKLCDDTTRQIIVVGDVEMIGLEPNLIMFIIFIVMLLIAIVCAIFVHEAFWGLSSLICAFMMATFIYYDFPNILTVMMGFMILLFSGMWILIGRKRH